MFAQPHVDSKAPPRRPRHGAPVAAAEFFSREATVATLALVGLDASLVRVTARIEDGPMAFEIMGLSEPRVRETRVRVKASLQAVGVVLPESRIRVEFDHPELVAGGTADLAIAVALVAVIDRTEPATLRGIAFVGELALTGAVRSVRGVLPMALGARELGVCLMVAPRENGTEAGYAYGTSVALVDHLADLVRHLREGVPLERAEEKTLPVPPAVPDLSEIRAMAQPRRALEVAAAGGHAMLLVGPQGSGRTMLARRLPGILPELTMEEILTLTSIFSVAGLLGSERPVVATRPFRAPHHTVSAAGVVGGGDPIRPGEVSLAHLGCLFLDEVLECKGAVLESLAQVLRDGRATLMRRGLVARFPAAPQLVCAAAPCFCGYAGSDAHACTCPPESVTRYRTRFGLPILSLVDLRLTVPPADVSTIQKAERGEPSKVVRERVTTARGMATERARLYGAAVTNAALTPSDLERVALPDATGASLLAGAERDLGLSEPDRNRILRVARTIADLDGKDAVTAAHVVEAIALAPAIPIRMPASADGGADAA